MIVSLIFWLLYTLSALGTAWFSYVVIGANLDSHPRTRDHNIGWLVYPLAAVCGIFWPVTIVLGIIIAGVLK